MFERYAFWFAFGKLCALYECFCPLAADVRTLRVLYLPGGDHFVYGFHSIGAFVDFMVLGDFQALL